MAAWTARIESIEPQGQDMFITVGFYDAADTTFANPLYQKGYTLDQTTSQQAIRSQVIADGTSARATRNKQAQIQAQLPPGTTVNIP